jgi:hypothetical protein
MCNCGNKRSEYRKSNLPLRATATPLPTDPGAATPAASSAAAPSTATSGKIKFMYTGRSSLRIVGDKSGRLYNFRIRGEMLEVSPDDLSGMMNHADLKMVKA